MRQMAQKVNEQVMPSTTRDDSPFTLGLVCALQGVLGHTKLCVARVVLKSASYHAMCQDCHLNERRQHDYKKDKMPSRQFLQTLPQLILSRKTSTAQYPQRNSRKETTD